MPTTAVNAIHQKFLKDLVSLQKRYLAIYAKLESEVKAKEIAALKNQIKNQKYVKRTQK